ncbi:NYN domain-containing protein [Mycena filopes]|nr:NYN domain-containing protein [Mycena filopes]
MLSPADPDVAIFWDYENCHASSQVSGYEIVSGIRNVAHRFGPVKYFKAYMEVPEPDTFRSLSLRSELQCSGVSLTDCPHNGRKGVADQMIMVDMLAYAMDHPAPATVILISGDRDFAYAVSTLRLRRYDVVVVSLPLPGAHLSLKSQASVYLDWNVDVMGYSPSTHFDGSPTTTRSPTNNPFQSPHARRSSYLPTPDSPYLTRAPAPDVKHVPAAAVTAESSTPASPPDPTIEHPPDQSTTQAEPEVIRVPAPAYSVSSAPLAGPSVPVAPHTITPTTPPFMAANIGSPPTATATAQKPQSFATTPATASTPVPTQSVGTNTVAPTPAPHQAFQTSTGQTWSSPAPSSHALFSEDLVAAHIQRCMDMAAEVVQPVLSTPQAGPSSLASNIPSATAPSREIPEARPPPAESIPTLAPPPPKVVPAIFKSLVECLERQRAKGIPRPLRSVVALDIMKDRQLYQRAGVQKFSQFAILAEQAKIIQLGGTQAAAWISLHPDLA